MFSHALLLGDQGCRPYVPLRGEIDPLMCGVVAVRRFEREKRSDANVPEIRRMTSTLSHRGPDETDVWAGDGISLGHTRLSIIDLSASHQPMHSLDGRWTLVFNGEIFNYRKLRDSLDYPFTTQGDTEVVLAGFQLQGPSFVERMLGQFAFIAHDAYTDVTHLVRDRLGVLPLYYSWCNGRLLAASEIKAILAADGISRAVDVESLDAYLGRRSVPAPDTLFEGIKKLPPGCRAEVGRDGSMAVTRYWFPPPVDCPDSWTDHEAVNAVDTAVRAAVKAALVADVPVGSYLSGGVDSSLIVAVVKSLNPDGVLQTFAAGFGDPRHDELPWARRVSEHVGSVHHDVQVRPHDFEGLWQRLTWHRDAPVSEPADVAVFRLAELAKRHVRVVLSGEGGDELFAGYPKYRLAPALARADVLPSWLRGSMAQKVDPLLTSRGARARIALRALGAYDEQERFETWFAPFTRRERATLLGRNTSRPHAQLPCEGADAIDRQLRYDLQSWLPDNLLERGDRMSMAASLELRPPLLDHRLAELAFRLPTRFKVRGGHTKWALKEVARRYLPEDVVDRQKVGFRVPLDSWFRSGLRDSVRDRLTGRESFVAQSLQPEAVQSLLRRHESGRFNEESRIWTLMCLEVWHETFFR